MNFYWFILTMLFAFIGGFVGYKLKLPAGALVGAIVGVIIANLTCGQTYFYMDIKIIIQVLSGAMIGSKIGKDDINEMKKIIAPTIFLLVAMIVLNLVFGSLIYKFSLLDVATSLFATSPGGMADMALIASELGANSSYVAVLQLFRILVIFIFMPPIFRKILSKDSNLAKKIVAKQSKTLTSATNAYKKETGRGQLVATSIVDQTISTTALALNGCSPNPQNILACIPAHLAKKIEILRESLVKNKRLFVMLAVAAVGGSLCYIMGITAGALTGGMVTSAAYCVFKGTVQFPGKLRFFMQVFSGAFIGTGIDKELLLTMSELIIPALIMFVGIFAFVFSTAYLMHKLFKLDLVVCLLSSTPGGVQEMSFLSEDLGGDTPKIAIMQTTRLMFVVILFPTMLKMILDLIS